MDNPLTETQLSVAWSCSLGHVEMRWWSGADLNGSRKNKRCFRALIESEATTHRFDDRCPGAMTSSRDMTECCG